MLIVNGLATAPYTLSDLIKVDFNSNTETARRHMTCFLTK